MSVALASTEDDFFGNNVWYPKQQFKWMDAPGSGTNPLAHLKPLDSLMVKQVVTMEECIY